MYILLKSFSYINIINDIQKYTTETNHTVVLERETLVKKIVKEFPNHFASI